MSNQNIRIRFPLGGKPVIEMQGFQGRSCMDASKFIKEALGTAGEREYKPEFYEVEVNTEHTEERS